MSDTVLDFDIREEMINTITVEDALANEDMVNSINYLIAEGLIEIEEDGDGNIRAYPAL